MAVDFPASPSPGATFTTNGVTYRFSDGAWTVSDATPPPGQTFLPTSGGIMTGPLRLHGDAADPLDAVPLRMVPMALLHNAPFPNEQNVEVDISGYRTVEIFWNGAVCEGAPAIFGMTVRAGSTWYEAANTYRLAGNSMSGTTFTGNISGTNFAQLLLSGTPIAGDWLPSGHAVLLNGDTNTTFRLHAMSQHISGAGMDQRDFWLTANTAIAALQRVPLTGLRFRWPATQKFQAGGWLQVRGIKG